MKKKYNQNSRRSITTRTENYYQKGSICRVMLGYIERSKNGRTGKVLCQNHDVVGGWRWSVASFDVTTVFNSFISEMVVLKGFGIFG